MAKRALLLMRQHVEDPLPIEEVARRVGMSRRSLERHFGQALGRSLSDCSLSIHLDQADMLLRTTDRTVAAVATARSPTRPIIRFPRH